MSRVGVAEAVRAAVRTSDLDERTWCPSVAMRLFGGVVDVAYCLDESEHARRVAAGVGAVTQRGVLDALMGLPVGLPVAVHDLSERERHLLQRVPHGVVDYDGRNVVRRAVAPLSVRFAMVTARSWREGLRKAGQFAPFCARAMLLPATPSDVDDACAQASFYGVGVCVFESGRLRMLVDPQPYVRHQHSAAQWRFAEEVYRQVMASANGAGVVVAE
ncbi:hypothetical protein [Kibdelosporangium aridum]|uniref:Uncharacterized protein n=1 Tax=Kibdelosporangium aridum TaxID=2030 RepID=A0A1Y5Y9Z8_KIBAR|nr:hypothetical protein [Kibdelosporangium aridum]SMD27627.1 hypothetical protein SAMN05661093_11237 [Kibdelosporangium aridum]